MLLSQIFNVIGLALDIIGFSILFVLALPVFMRRNFVTSDRVDLDGIRMDQEDQVERIMDRPRAKLLDQRRRQRQTCWYYVGGLTVLVGFALQIVALFVP